MADLAGIPLFKGEAMLLGWGDSSSQGMTVRFQLHVEGAEPVNPFRGLGTGKHGQRFQVVAVPITDEGEPVASVGGADCTNDHTAINPPEARTPGEGEGVGSAPKEPAQQYKGVPSDRTKRHWDELSLQEQMGIRCNDPRFQAWCLDPVPSLARAAREDAAVYIRIYCGVKSRSEIQPGTEAANLWAALEADFLAATGQMAEERR